MRGWIVAALLVLPGCALTSAGGPTFQDIPPGLASTGEMGAKGMFVAGHREIRSKNWFTIVAPQDRLVLGWVEYEGHVTAADVEAVRLAIHQVEQRSEQARSLPALEPTTIDGCKAWRWTSVGPERSGCTAIVDGGDVFYVVGASTIETAPGSDAAMRELVSRFRRSSGGLARLLPFAGAGLAAILVVRAWRRRGKARAACGVAAALVLSAACSTSPLEGPQFVGLPAGVGYVADPIVREGTLGGHRLTLSRSWGPLRPPPHVSASLSQYEGHVGAGDIEALRLELLRLERGSRKADELAPFVRTSIDGRVAWGWTQRDGSFAQHVAFVDGGDVFYVVGVSSSDPKLGTDAELKRMAGLFRRDPDRLARTALPLGAAAIVALVALAWWRRRTSGDPGDAPVRSSREF